MVRVNDFTGPLVDRLWSLLMVATGRYPISIIIKPTRRPCRHRRGMLSLRVLIKVLVAVGVSVEIHSLQFFFFVGQLVVGRRVVFGSNAVVESLLIDCVRSRDHSVVASRRSPVVLLLDVVHRR